MGRLIDIDVLFDYFGNDAIDETTRSNIEYFVSEKGTVEAIPKADYKNRLKADLKAILVELQLEIEESENCGKAFHLGLQMASNIIQQKINELPPVTPHKKLAHWIGEEYDGYADGAPVYTSWVCSECGATFMCEDMDFLYCPRCGSVMEV